MGKGREQRRDESDQERESDGASAVSEIIRRFATLGLTGLFTTESALRRALGDTVPKEWVDFAADQSERTRHELLDRVAQEFGKLLERVEVNELVEYLLEGRTIEVSAQIRLGAKAPKPADSDVESECAAPSQVKIIVDED